MCSVEKNQTNSTWTQILIHNSVRNWVNSGHSGFRYPHSSLKAAWETHSQMCSGGLNNCMRNWIGPPVDLHSLHVSITFLESAFCWKCENTHSHTHSEKEAAAITSVSMWELVKPQLERQYSHMWVKVNVLWLWPISEEPLCWWAHPGGTNHSAAILMLLSLYNCMCLHMFIIVFTLLRRYII